MQGIEVLCGIFSSIFQQDLGATRVNAGKLRHIIPEGQMEKFFFVFQSRFMFECLDLFIWILLIPRKHQSLLSSCPHHIHYHIQLLLLLLLVLPCTTIFQFKRVNEKLLFILIQVTHLHPQWSRHHRPCCAWPLPLGWLPWLSEGDEAGVGEELQKAQAVKGVLASCRFMHFFGASWNSNYKSNMSLAGPFWWFHVPKNH